MKVARFHGGETATVTVESSVQVLSRFTQQQVNALLRAHGEKLEYSAREIEWKMSTYRDFLGLWKDADIDIPLFARAKSEYAKLQ